MAMSWETSTSVVPLLARSSSSRLMTEAAFSESRLPVGSSDRSSSGWLARLRAIATRWRSPPDSANGRCLARLPRPTWSSSAAARPRRSGAASPVPLIAISTFSIAVSVGSSRNSWNTMPILFRRSSVHARRSLTSSPCQRTRPALGLSNPAMMWMRLVLPLPLGPTIDTNSPRPTAMLMPRSAVTAPSSKMRLTLSSEISGAAASFKVAARTFSPTRPTDRIPRMSAQGRRRRALPARAVRRRQARPTAGPTPRRSSR